MKKNYYSNLSLNKLKKSFIVAILSAGLSFNLIAQPVLQSSNLQTGISFNLYSLSGVNTSAVLAANGANVTWNLSTATLGSPVGLIDFMDMASTGYASAYPSANFAMKFTIGVNFKYNLSVVTISVMEDTAINVGSGGLQTFLDNRTTLLFPFTYGLTNTDTYQKSGQLATTVTHNYDAYGTLIVGLDTLHNLVRDMSTDNGVNTTQAVWWNVSPLYPVLQVSSSGATFFKSTAVASIKQLVDKNTPLNIYPNPTSDQFFIDANASDKLTVDLYDVNGRHVLSQSVNNKTNIDVASFNDGVYTLTIKSVDRVINKKLVIVR